MNSRFSSWTACPTTTRLPAPKKCKPLSKHLQVLSNPKRLSSAARNVGVRHARGRYLVIVDGHCAIHDRQYLSKMAAAFERSGADCLGRPQPLRVEGASAFQLAVAAARESWLGHNPDSDIYSDRPRYVPPDNVAVAYKREVFDKVGLFDEQFDACEDVEFNTRVRQAGLTCYFEPAIRADYQPRGTLSGFALSDVSIWRRAFAARAEASLVDHAAESRAGSLAGLANVDVRARVRVAACRGGVLRVAVALFAVSSGGMPPAFADAGARLAVANAVYLICDPYWVWVGISARSAAVHSSPARAPIATARRPAVSECQSWRQLNGISHSTISPSINGRHTEPYSFSQSVPPTNNTDPP